MTHRGPNPPDSRPEKTIEKIITTTDTHHHCQVILIDDDYRILEDLRLAIETDPEISVAGTGFDGSYVLDLVQTRHPDVVLMDVEISKARGIAVTR